MAKQRSGGVAGDRHHAVLCANAPNSSGRILGVFLPDRRCFRLQLHFRHARAALDQLGGNLLVFLLETLLGSIWIWLLIGQQPELHEIAGGAVVGLAVVVVVMSAVRAKDEPKNAPPSPPAAEQRS